MKFRAFLMSSGRKTKRITFNIKERGRKHTGVTRSNVDYQTWIDLINSPATQEMIATGSMLGYYGHQLRIMFGLQVPETAIVGGKQINISPAVRTTEMTCDKDGNVTHRQEFLETPEGEHAMQKYRANIGGFSAVNDFESINGVVYPTVSFGFDYVLQPNYSTNIGDGALLDGIQGDLVRSTTELSLLEMYDSIHTTNHLNMMLDEKTELNFDLENNILELQHNKATRERLQAEKKEKMLDSALCPTTDLDEYIKQSTGFMDSAVNTDIKPKANEKLSKKTESLGGWFGGLFG